MLRSMNLRLTGFKRFVNATSQNLHGHFLRTTLIVTLIVLFGGACAPQQPIVQLRHPWRLERVIESPTPVDRPALWADESTHLLLWAGEPTMPNIRLLLPTQETPIALPLGIRPRRLSIYPLPDGWYQLLWLDQTLPDQAFLVGGTLNAAFEVHRGPTEIARGSVLEYVAVTSPDGMVVAFWTILEQGEPRLYGMRIDSLGRPRSPILIAETARFPAAAFDQAGDLRLVWAEPGAGRIWTVRSVKMLGGALESAPALYPDQIALIPLNTQQTLEALTLALDSTQAYLIWGLAQAGQGVSGRLEGMILAPDGRTTSIPLPQETNLRLPAGPTGGRLAQGAIFTVLMSQNSASPNAIGIITVRPNGGMELALITPSPLPGVIGGVSAALLDSGKMRMGWSLLRPDGRTQLYEAVEGEAAAAP
ncbi:hypothetical protein ANRL4_03473 [Anaerolineae bacterium]|nr:hypothetical protein ANRL4_03473 [Anaerolineae bacterium]